MEDEKKEDEYKEIEFADQNEFRFSFSISSDLELQDLKKILIDYFDVDQDKAQYFGIFDEDGDEVDCSLRPPPDERRVERQIEII